MSYSTSHIVIAEMPFSKKEFKCVAKALTTFIGRHPSTNCPVLGPNVSPKPSTSNPWRILKWSSIIQITIHYLYLPRINQQSLIKFLYAARASLSGITSWSFPLILRRTLQPSTNKDLYSFKNSSILKPVLSISFNSMLVLLEQIWFDNGMI
jgi:hypothetical protein